jgi:hypothetical protein
LTKENASKIYDVSGTPSFLNPYKDQIVQYMVEYSTTLDPTQRIPANELIEQASSVCGKELQRAARNVDPSWTDEQKFTILYGIAIALVAGFKDTYRTHFQVDSNNEIIDLIHPHQQRQLECDQYLKQKRSEMLKRKLVATGEPSDAYKGSQQGTGKTIKKKKKNKKSKKTLRRK